MIGLGCGGLIRDRLLNYDFLGPGPSLDGHVNIGDLTTVRELIRYPGEPDQWAWTNRRYDAFGNIVEVRSPDGAVTFFAHQGPDYTYRSLESITVFAGKAASEGSYPVTLTTNTAWDTGLGVELSTTDPNRRTTWKVYRFLRPTSATLDYGRGFWHVVDSDRGH